MQSVKVYLDLPLFSGLLGWIQDAALLWLIAQITSYKVPFRRWFWGGAIGGLFQGMLILNQVSGGLVHRWVLSPVVFILLVPGLMMGVTFYPLSGRKLFRVAGYFYLLAFLLSGIHWGIDRINQLYFQAEIAIHWRFWLNLGLIFILGEVGWGIIHQKIWEQVCLYPLEVHWDSRTVFLTALLDTGNTLTDPLTKTPVILVELEVFKPYLPPELLIVLEQLQKGNLASVWDLPTGWEGRFRVVPFHGVGKNDGMLIGFRPDQVVIGQQPHSIRCDQVVIALYQNILSPEGIYQGLIPPIVLKR